MYDTSENHPAEAIFSKLKFEMLSDGILVLRPLGPLKSEDFDNITAVVDPWVETHGDLQGILICVEKFPGWENFASFLHHFEFVQAHRKLVRRVALVVDGLLPEIMSKLGSHFLPAEIRQFPFDEETAALNWLRKS